MPDRLRHSARARALALRTGLAPTRTMLSPGESALLAELARGRRRAVEIGVYEGSSALVLAWAVRSTRSCTSSSRSAPAWSSGSRPTSTP
jgi:predicted O-methyltransferase YrrM